MSTLFVTTASDVTDATDGLTSLREAVAAANALRSAATIRFDPALFASPNPLTWPTFELRETLLIRSGAQITLDGTTRSPTSDAIIVGASGPVVQVETGASLVLRDIDLVGSRTEGVDSVWSGFAARGLDGAHGRGSSSSVPALAGINGTDGFDGADGNAGQAVTGGIVNLGTLVLERVELRNIDVSGGNGAQGGFGGNGGWGGQGGWGFVGEIRENPQNAFLAAGTQLQAAADGGAGGRGGDGGDGGRGGDAVAGILNLGHLTLRDASFINMVATGGTGGFGGAGGRGGEGGSPGVMQPADILPFNVTLTLNNPGAFLPGPQGGAGGNGGDAGRGGNGGDAAGAVLNRGTLVIEGAQSSVDTVNLSAGAGRPAVSAGAAGFSRGSEYDPTAFPNQFSAEGSSRGPDGQPGLASGLNGTAGRVGAFVGTAVNTAPDTFIVEASRNTVTEPTGTAVTSFSFFIHRLGAGIFTERTVSYTITGSAGVIAGDFASQPWANGRLGNGTVTFGSGSTLSPETTVVFAVAQDGLAGEGDETVTLTLTGATDGGGIGWTRQASVTILSPLVHGGDGNDSLPGTAGADNFNGGAGNDTYTINNAGDRVTEAAGAGRDHILSSRSLTLPDNVEDLTLTGTAALDGTGNALSNRLTGNAAANRLSGEAGQDTLLGGDGSDTLNGGSGDDFLFGGSSAADLRDVAFGGDGNDSIDGGAGNDSLSGGNGNDTVLGDVGADTLVGNDGDDLIGGGAGSDLMFGNAGNDTLNGGFGFDRMNGGTGADSFIHAGVAGHASDWIQDYNAAEGDVLVVGLAGATRAQFQINTTFTANAGAAGVAEAFIIYRPTGQILWALVDGDGQSSINVNIGGQVFDLVA